MYLVEMNRLIHTKRCAVCGVRCVLCIVSTLTFHFMGGGEGGLNRALVQKTKGSRFETETAKILSEN